MALVLSVMVQHVPTCSSRRYTENLYVKFSYTHTRGTHAGQVKGDDPDKKGHPGPPGWGLGMGLTTPIPENKVML